MLEVEVKVRGSHGEVRRRLDELGADRLEAVVQRDTYYDAPHRDFAETDEALRLRRETPAGGDGRSVDGTPIDSGDGRSVDGTPAAGGDGRSVDGTPAAGGDAESTPERGATRVTYKGPLVEAASKTRSEYETGVDDGETMDAILRELGFSPAAVVEKERERFAVGEYTVTLDRVTDVGEFVEVERQAPESELESVREGAHDVLRRLGFDPDEQIRTSYLGMLLGDSPE